jgi:APA family basic amino acid/polyamine antiporter
LRDRKSFTDLDKDCEAMSKELFRRKSSGLVRQMSLFDVAWWGIAGSGGFYLLFYFMPYAQYYLPGADLGWAIALCLLVMLPLYALYAGLGSSMPRAGGDYVYQSRILHPAIGVIFPLGWFTVVWIATFVAFGGYVIASLGLAPVFLLIGTLQSNSVLIGWANWLQLPDGQFAASVVTGILSLAVTVLPLKWWIRSQRWILFPFTLITNVVLIYLLAGANTQSFHNAFNYWSGLMGSPSLYETIVKANAAAGYAVPAFSLRNTFLLMSVLSIYIAWTMWASTGILGEVKRANDFKRLFASFSAAGLYLQWIALFIPIALFTSVVGWDFLNQIANAYYLPNSVVPFYPTVSLLVSMLTTSPVLIVLLSLGLIAGGFFIAASEFVIVTRIWIAMSLDRMLPGWMGSVSMRTHTPVKPTILCFVVSLIAAYLFDFWPPFYSVIAVGAVAGPTGVVFVTSLAAIVFWKRRPQTFVSSPMSRYKVGPVPVMSIFGVLAAIASGALFIVYLTAPELGYNAPVPILYTAGILVLCAVWYFVNSAYQKGKGVDVNQAFRELPPE